MASTRSYFGLLSLVLFFYGEIHGQDIRGVVTSNGHPVEDVNVLIEEAGVQTSTDVDGAFTFSGLSPGRYTVAFSHVQFQYDREIIQLGTSKDVILQIELDPVIVQLEEITVSNTRVLSGISMLRITEEETRRYPGTFFDPGRFASSFPGIQQANDQTNQLAINGMHPDLMQWHIEGMEILSPNHLGNAGTLANRPVNTGGSVNMLSNQLLANSRFTGSYEPGFQANALAGIMDMYFRKGNPVKREYTAQIGLLGIEAAAEGPFKKGGGSSFLANYRYSTVGLLTSLGIDFGDEDIRFQDLSLVAHFPIGKGELKVFAFGGLNSNEHESLPMDEVESQDDYIDYDYDARGGTAGVRYDQPLGRKGNVSLGAALSGNHYELNSSSNYPVPTDDSHAESGDRSKLSAFLKYSATIARASFFETGVSVTRDWINVSGQADNFNDLKDFLIDGDNLILRPYASYSTQLLPRLVLRGGLGATYFDNNSGVYLEPEMELSWQVSSKSQMQLAYRLTSQALNDLYFTGVSDDFPNIDLGPVRAHTLQIQYHILVGRGTLETALFYYDIFDAPGSTAQGDFSILNLYAYPVKDDFMNNSSAYSYGASVGYRRDLIDGYYINGNVSYFNTQYSGSDGIERPSTFNTTITSYLGGGKEWKKQRDYGVRFWGLSASFIYKGGLYDTEIDADASVELGRTTYVPGTAGDLRTPDYHRMDLRIYLRKDKAGHSSTWSLDVQNLYNHENIWLSRYDQILGVSSYTQLGVVPVLSYRIDF